MEFVQNYIPLGNVYISALIAGIPIVVLLVMLGALRAAAFVSAVAVALFFYGMPVPLTVSSVLYGAVFGLWPIAWIVLNERAIR